MTTLFRGAKNLASYAFLALHANEIEGDSNNEKIRDDEIRNINFGKFCETLIQLYTVKRIMFQRIMFLGSSSQCPT